MGDMGGGADEEGSTSRPLIRPLNPYQWGSGLVYCALVAAFFALFLPGSSDDGASGPVRVGLAVSYVVIATSSLSLNLWLTCTDPSDRRLKRAQSGGALPLGAAEGVQLSRNGPLERCAGACCSTHPEEFDDDGEAGGGSKAMYCQYCQADVGARSKHCRICNGEVRAVRPVAGRCGFCLTAAVFMHVRFQAKDGATSFLSPFLNNA